MTLTLDPRQQKPMIVPYLDLGGGLDTVTDDHALDANQLSESINCWHAYGRSLSKRPGSTPFVTANGATGAGGICSGLVTARFNNHTYVIVQMNGNQLWAAKQGDSAYVQIGTMSVGAGSIQAAQMFDPNTGLSTLWIVNGVDYPLAWQGPGYSVVAASSLTGAQVPYNYQGSNFITPTLVTAFQNYLLYSGEPTATEAVYVSNPFFPNNFTIPSSTTTVGPSNSQPYLVGFNDGVLGGKITGLCALETGVLIFKESAIYSFTLVGFYNGIVFYPQIISASTGCSAARSIVRFDGFCVFQAIDGIYMISLTNPAQLISAAVGTYFDNSLAGYPAICTDNTSGVGVRHGGRYIIWFSSGRTGYANDTGIWFDFRKLDKNGLPTCGEINGMQVGGAAPLRGPVDDGNFIWGDISYDRVSKFGLGFSDPIPGEVGYAQPIQATFFGKSDFLDSAFPEDGFLRPKQVNRIWLVLSLFGHLSTGEFVGSLTFQGTWNGGGSYGVQSASNTQTLPVEIGSTTTWGNNWGTLTWSGSTSSAQPYALIEMDTPSDTIANNYQIGFSESSANGWVVIGYMVEVVVGQPLQGSYNVL